MVRDLLQPSRSAAVWAPTYPKTAALSDLEDSKFKSIHDNWHMMLVTDGKKTPPVGQAGPLGARVGPACFSRM